MPGVTRAEAKEGVPMPTTTDGTRRTAHLLELMTNGDDLFNARDWQALDEVHHPDMIAHIPGSAEPIYGREAHGAAMKQLVRMFPDIRVHTPYPVQFGSGDWITVVTNVTGTFTVEMTLPDGTVIPPTGKAFDLEFAQTSKWDGDRLIVISAFWDAALQALQLGTRAVTRDAGPLAALEAREPIVKQANSRGRASDSGCVQRRGRVSPLTVAFSW